jgi:hypothetical protein
MSHGPVVSCSSELIVYACNNIDIPAINLAVQKNKEYGELCFSMRHTVFGSKEFHMKFFMVSNPTDQTRSYIIGQREYFLFILERNFPSSQPHIKIHLFL